GFALRRPTEVREPVRFSLHAPEGTRLTGTPNSATALQFAISPDGKTFAFVATGADGQPRIWLRELASVEARPLAGTEGAFFPFWSPDGKEIAFFAQRKLKRIPANGGAPVDLADANDARGGSWSRDGVIVYVPIAGPTPMYRIPAAGGDPAPATFSHEINEHHPGHRWPSFLPDGRRFLYFSLGDDHERQGIWTGSLDSKEAHFVTESDSGAQYVSGGLLFVRRGALYFQRFDLRSAKTDGDAVVVQRNVGYAPVICYGAFSAAGRVAAFAPWINPGRQLALLDRRGTMLAKFGDPADWGTTALSLHGENAVLPRSDPDTGNLDLWLVDVRRNVSMRLTSTGVNENHPVWSPDGSAIAYTLATRGKGQLAIRRGERSEERALSVDIDRPTGWTPDGRQIVVQGRVLAGRKLWVVNASGSLGQRPLREGETEEAEGVVSPDGKWIAYASNEKGRFEVFVQPFPMRGERYPISTAGGVLPKWSPDGRELFFLSADKKIASVRVLESATRFRATAPEMLFAIPGNVPDPEAYRTAYAPTADGNFLMVLSHEQEAPATITVMVDWRGALGRD
ncbi:MAG TPA: hypothetical protein VNL91_00420, partial [Thermoanaerobaculia bacterium]|nr:hypothetical protein [Thermoanaerobaculia bacterium]